MQNPADVEDLSGEKYELFTIGCTFKIHQIEPSSDSDTMTNLADRFGPTRSDLFRRWAVNESVMSLLVMRKSWALLPHGFMSGRPVAMSLVCLLVFPEEMSTSFASAFAETRASKLFSKSAWWFPDNVATGAQSAIEDRCCAICP